MLAVVEPDKRQCQQSEALLLDLRGPTRYTWPMSMYWLTTNSPTALGEAAAPAAPRVSRNSRMMTTPAVP